MQRRVRASDDSTGTLPEDDPRVAPSPAGLPGSGGGPAAQLWRSPSPGFDRHGIRNNNNTSTVAQCSAYRNSGAGV
jgi:hypothetical protein